MMAQYLDLDALDAMDISKCDEIAPLRIVKARSTPNDKLSHHSRESSTTSHTTYSSECSAQRSRPRSPRRKIDTPVQVHGAQPTCHNYMRAFYPFHPLSTISTAATEASITISIQTGDVILVHSVHPNGWADGTLLSSGARGWLPTNYCDVYEPCLILPLLDALKSLWDVFGAVESGRNNLLAKQDYVLDFIAGVRTLLEKTGCVDRESPLVLTHASLRRTRKALLGDLSSYVKSTKQIQEKFLDDISSAELLYQALDDIILKAFKVVTRAVRFLDAWFQKAGLEGMPDELQQLENRAVSAQSVRDVQLEYGRDSRHVGLASARAPSVSPMKAERQPRPNKRIAQNRALSATPTFPRVATYQPKHRVARSQSFQTRRASNANRLSYSNRFRRSELGSSASERLRAAHDVFLSLIGSFIGLHLHSRSPSDLLSMTQKSVEAGTSLLKVIESVRDRDPTGTSSLCVPAEAMNLKLTNLVQTAKGLLNASHVDNEESVGFNQGKQMVAAATSCVLSAGDCVFKARLVLEGIGDFTIESGLFETSAGGFGNQAVNTVSEETASYDQDVTLNKENMPPTEPSECDDQNAEETPLATPERGRPSLSLSPLKIPDRPSILSFAESPVIPTCHQLRLSLSSLSQDRPSSVRESYASLDAPESPNSTMQFLDTELGVNSINASVTDSVGTCPDSTRDSGCSNLSETSTRATTPDRSPFVPNRDLSLVTSFGSFSELQFSIGNEEDEVKEQESEKTFTHELVHNKEGHVVGGSLPALVERLTTHDSTPDASFVSAFYLTFRLFTTPIDFTEALIHRFDYVGDFATNAIPVRLRVYNVFKGWLESHWQSDTDYVALNVILEFAEGKMQSSLPAAGKRLAELAQKVSEIRGTILVPRLMSSVGKASIAMGVPHSIDAQAPSPIISKTQLNNLKSWATSNPPLTILAFDPLELARQITLIVSRIFCSIQPEELLALEWTKKTESKAVNVRAMSTLSTDLANLVADSILGLEEPKKRAAMIKQWVKVAMKCLELNNYDSLMAIVCSLNSSMILRLKRTWDLVSQKTKARLEELGSITDVAKNYTVLRQRLQGIVAPCIPFVGLYLTDLTFVDAGNHNTRQLPAHGSGTGETVINFDKHMRTANIIGQLQRFQIPHRLTALPEMQEWMESQIQRLRANDEANVRGFYRRSLHLEPRLPQQGHVPADSASSVASAKTRESGKEKFDLLSSLHFGSHAGSKEKLSSS